MILMLSSLHPSSLAQTDSLRVKDVFVLKPGSSFVNITDSTYFAIPRYRLEHLLVDAQLADSLRVMWTRDRVRLTDLLSIEEGRSSFWRTVAEVTGVVVLLELLGLILR